VTKAYLKEKDEKYALCARKTIEAWLDSHPYDGEGPYAPAWVDTGDSTLSLSLRIGQRRLSGWWGCIPYLEDSAHFDKPFIERVYASTMDQLKYLRKHMSALGNWRVSQLDAMLYLGLVLDGAAEYLAYAVRELNEAFTNQVEPDGSHTEHTGGYHMWMTNVFTANALLAKARPELKLRADNSRIIKMWDYYVHQYAPDGRCLGLNDDGRWYALMPPEDVAAVKQKRMQVIKKLGLDPDGCPLGASGFYPNAGQYFFRKSWDNASPMVVYDNTNYGGWHCHTGRGGVQFFDGKRMLLMDPGSINYDGKDPFTNAGKQTLMHNTVTIDDMVQLPYADARMDLIADMRGASLAVGTYVGGYIEPHDHFAADAREKGKNSVAARHTRCMVWIKDAFIFVVDTLSCMEVDYRFRSQWQMDAGDVNLVDNGAYTDYTDGNVLVRAVECTAPLTCKIYCGHEKPLLGYISKNGARLGSGEPAPMLGIEGTGSVSETVLAQAIVPFNGKSTPKVESVYTDMGASLYWDIIIGDTAWHIGANRQLLTGGGEKTQVGEYTKLTSDGFIAAVGERNGAVFYGTAVNASYLAYGGKVLIDKPQTGDYEIYFD